MAITSLICKFCKRTFAFNLGDYWHLGYSEVPQACPTCTDLRQGRPQIVLDRTEVACFAVKNEIPAWLQWERVEGTGRPRGQRDFDRRPWRITLQGKNSGADWSGRIDLWCVRQLAPIQGQICTFKHMKVRTLVGKKLWQRQTQDHGQVEGLRQIPLWEVFAIERFAAQNLKALVGQREDAICTALQSLPTNERCEWMIEEREYLVLAPMKTMGDCPRSLAWVDATTKTTFKGLGRQYRADIDTNDTLWSWQCRGGVRSGRQFTVSALAVVDARHPIRVTHREDGEENVYTYPDPHMEGTRIGRAGPRPAAVQADVEDYVFEPGEEEAYRRGQPYRRGAAVQEDRNEPE